MSALTCHLLLALLFFGEFVHGARISQRLVGGHAKVESPNSNKNDEAQEEKKTLSQQVSEGKYGLIQKELFETPPKRLGVLSYGKNSDVPKDNENSLGGLGPDEIWLAEDHLLVLKGGSFHRTASELPWPPIDDYRAPNRQVKIPSQPKVPPPFPVQLKEGGPIQFLGINITRTANGSLAIPGADGTPAFFIPFPDGEDPSNTSAGGAPFPLPPYIISEGPENFNRGNGPGPFPYPGPLPFPPPPPPNLNQSLDEDDPSIYYPPPYSFFYPKDNSSKVPPGPLVPGIVLPPPPDFFAALDPETTAKPPTSTIIVTTTPPPPPPSSTSPPITITTIKSIPTTIPVSPSISIPVKVSKAPPTSPLPPPPRTHIVVADIPRPPIRYLPYDNSKTTKTKVISFQEVPYDENELTETPNPVTPVPVAPQSISSIPLIRIPVNAYITSTLPPTYNTGNQHHQQQQQRQRTRLRPTSPPVSTTPTVYFSEEFEAKEKTPSRVMMPPLEPTVTSVPVIQVPKTYLRPTTVNPIVSNSIQQAIPVVQISYGGGNGNQRPRTYLKPASISNTVSPIPVLQVPYNHRPRTYLKPTQQPIPVQFLPYDSKNNHQIKSTAVPPGSSVPTVPVLRVPPRTQVSSTAVPLKSFYSDVNTNSVQPHAEYYFYEEEDATPRPQSIPQRLRYVPPPTTNFEKHIQQLRQQIQSYLKPAARPVYEYSFQAANYRPTKPPTRYLTPAPPQQYAINHQIPVTARYQQQQPQSQHQYRHQQQQQQQQQDNDDQQAYYTKQDERLLDDITKKYFTVFGQKITTPVTPQLALAGDTIVNYRKPRPPINHQAEYINIRPQQPQQQSPGEPGTFISYALPGEGAHFYFLTPQLVQQQKQQQQQQQQQQEQQTAYYYDKPENPSRIRRRRNQR